METRPHVKLKLVEMYRSDWHIYIFDQHLAPHPPNLSYYCGRSVLLPHLDAPPRLWNIPQCGYQYESDVTIRMLLSLCIRRITKRSGRITKYGEMRFVL